jgi:tetratricopeptide (TPR) repeat protein
MKRQLNARFLLWLIIAVVVIGTSVHLVHSFQSRRNAGGFLTQAARREEQGDLGQATEYLRRYLAYVPEDNNALAKYGLLLNQQASTPGGGQPVLLVRAFSALEQVVRREPDRADARRTLVELAMKLGDFTGAKDHLDVLLQSSTNDGELEALYARCEESLGKFPSAASWLAKAIQHTPQKIENYERLVLLLRKRLDPPQPRQADKVMDDLIAVNNQSFRAYLSRSRYRQAFHSPQDAEKALQEAEKDLDAARKLAPKEPEVLLAYAEVLRAQGKLAEARRYLQQGIEYDPENVTFYQALALLEQQAGRPQDGLASLRQGLKRVTGDKENALRYNLAELLIQQGKLAEAGDLLERLGKDSFSPALLDYLGARIDMRNSQWDKASARLLGARPQLARSPELSLRIQLLLGDCYGHLSTPDRQLGAYRHALEIDPLSITARVGLAATLLSLGRIDDAMAEYKRITNLRDAPASTWITLARLQTLHNLRLPQQQRDWQPVEETLNQAAKVAPEASNLTVLRAEVLEAQGSFERARELLERARDKQPKQVALWTALADLAAQEGKPDLAGKILDQARRQLGDRVELHLTQLLQVSMKTSTEARKYLATTESDLGKFNSADQLLLLEALANAYLRLNDTANAKRVWNRLVQHEPTNLRFRLIAFDMALQEGNKDEMERCVKALNGIEGEKGTLWRYAKATRLIELAKREKDKSGLAEVRELLDVVAKQRPTWSAVPALAGELEELTGRPDDALKSYLKAIEQGARQPQLIRRLVQLLFERRRYEQAFATLGALQEQTPLSSEQRRLAAEVALYTEAPERGLEFARKAAAAEPNDYRNLFWLGLLQAASGQQAEAEASLRRAVELGDNKVPETWVALTQFLTRTGQKTKAEKVIEEAKKKLPADQAALALAYCYELVAPVARAEAEYQKALASKPDDALVLFNVATFYIRNNQFDKGQPVMRKLIEPRSKATQDQVSWARRVLAVELASTNNYQHFQEARTLIEANLETQGATSENQRAKALVLSVRPEHRDDAIRMLEEANSRQALAAHELYALSRLYEANRDWPKARERMLRALGSPGGENVTYLATYVRDLLAHGEATEAETWLARLEKIAPQSPSTIALKALWLKAQHKNKEAADLLKEHARDKDADPLTVAGLLEQVGDPSAAEEMFRQAVSESGKDMPAYISFLLRQKRVDAALDLSERAWKACKPESVASALVNGIRGSGANETQLRRAERDILAALQREPESVGLLLALADLRQLQGRFKEAETIHRQVIARDPVNVIALNNLAWLMALQGGDPDESLHLVQRAIDNAGSLAPLLDTRGLSYLARGAHDNAIKDLEAAVKQQPTVSRYIHLARAQMLAGNPTAAAEAWRKAQSLGLKPGNVHPLDRPAYAQLQKELEPK